MDSQSEKVELRIAEPADYDKVLGSPDGPRFYHAVITNSPRVWTSRAENSSYCEQFHMNLAVPHENTSSRFVEYNTWVKLANMTDGGQSIQPEETLNGLLFDTKEVKRYSLFFDKSQQILRSPCGDVNCNCATHIFEATPPRGFYRRSPRKAALLALCAAVLLVVVITVPIMATRKASKDDDSKWETTKY